MKIAVKVVPTSVKEVTVVFTYSVILIVVFILYTAGIIENRECKNDMKSLFISNFIVTDLSSLIVNLFTLYSLSEIELVMGSKNFSILFILSLILNTLIDYQLHKMNPKLGCVSNVNGVLFSLVVCNLIITGKVSPLGIVTIGMILTFVTLKNSKTTFLNHSIGALSGLILGIFYKKKLPKNMQNLIKKTF